MTFIDVISYDRSVFVFLIAPSRGGSLMINLRVAVNVNDAKCVNYTPPWVVDVIYIGY